MEPKILVLDDEREIADLISLYLKNEGYEVFTFYESLKAYEFVKKQPLDLALIDIMMEEMDGFTFCSKIRETYHFPIIMLTAKVSDADKIQGLTLGADDYITKPFNPLEVVARVKAALRRYQTYNASKEHLNTIDYKGLIIKLDSHECTLYDEPLNLTPIEFSILWYLLKNKGRAISSEELFEAVWKEKYFESNNTVMVHINRLREKMKDSPRNPKFIQTVWGIGYKIDD